MKIFVSFRLYNFPTNNLLLHKYPRAKFSTRFNFVNQTCKSTISKSEKIITKPNLKNYISILFQSWTMFTSEFYSQYNVRTNISFLSTIDKPFPYLIRIILRSPEQHNRASSSKSKHNLLLIGASTSRTREREIRSRFAGIPRLAGLRHRARFSNASESRSHFSPVTSAKGATKDEEGEDGAKKKPRGGCARRRREGEFGEGRGEGAKERRRGDFWTNSAHSVRGCYAYCSIYVTIVHPSFRINLDGRQRGPGLSLSECRVDFLNVSSPGFDSSLFLAATLSSRIPLTSSPSLSLSRSFCGSRAINDTD